ncbi:hypothetical protein GCM10010211_71190 [Streptomyces albospinus]|uniref:Uncharacterized protein n=1 Tax=Streptomyces albospinus TaxID=285515 RepID=A0ABQ2VKS7_9ACTN|nr:hypothetical protein GCM10010211_71190 [Streptomyces albospinus]
MLGGSPSSNTISEPPGSAATERRVANTFSRVRYGTTPSQLKKGGRCGSNLAACKSSVRVRGAKSTGRNVSDGGGSIPAAAGISRFHAWVDG